MLLLAGCFAEPTAGDGDGTGGSGTGGATENPTSNGPGGSTSTEGGSVSASGDGGSTTDGDTALQDSSGSGTAADDTSGSDTGGDTTASGTTGEPGCPTMVLPFLNGDFEDWIDQETVNDWDVTGATTLQGDDEIGNGTISLHVVPDPSDWVVAQTWTAGGPPVPPGTIEIEVQLRYFAGTNHAPPAFELFAGAELIAQLGFDGWMDDGAWRHVVVGFDLTDATQTLELRISNSDQTVEIDDIVVRHTPSRCPP